jgi:hypothetical protein
VLRQIRQTFPQPAKLREIGQCDAVLGLGIARPLEEFAEDSQEVVHLHRIAGASALGLDDPAAIRSTVSYPMG